MTRQSQRVMTLAGATAIALAGLLGQTSSASAKTHIHMTAVESDIVIDGGGEKVRRLDLQRHDAGRSSTRDRRRHHQLHPDQSRHE